jgi:UDP-GlcNAc3NAcA epimerase
MTVLTIVGARPQFIKAAPVSRAFLDAGIREILVHTGQHYDVGMSDVFFEELGIPKPEVNLGVGSGSHGWQTGRMLEGIEALLQEHLVDWLLVYGDTNSTLAGALAAAKLHIPVAHVEAGLRSYNRRMPEEVNRVLTDHVSAALLAPTETAVENLIREGIPEDRIHHVGDVMYDAALYFGERAESRQGILADYELSTGEYVLATIHRAENTDDPARLEIILGALAETAEQMPVVLPLHPRTRSKLKGAASSRLLESLMTIEPLGYLDMVMFEKNARLVVTDSGGVQKEAFFHRIPCVTVRDETEWIELVKMGWNRLAPPVNVASVRAAIEGALASSPEINGRPYGDGSAAHRIVDVFRQVTN